MTTIAILGSTGSIGRQTLDVVAAHPERLTVLGIVGRDQLALRDQAQRFGIPLVGVANVGEGQPLEVEFPPKTEVLRGSQALIDLATHPEADIVVVATVGRSGLEATLAAVRAGKRVAIANKEVLVMAGAIITAEARAHGATLLPIDSEHSAIWQCLLGEERRSVNTILLTASGGALRDYDAASLESITPEQALRHPTWVMGPKVTVDTATLMNKGLEVMEARWLFDVPLERIRIVIHPTSTVHSLVGFSDGVVKAQLGAPDMRAPIQFALSYPERWPLPPDGPDFDITRTAPLVFNDPQPGRYPCLDLALRAGHSGGTYPAALCGADEVAVELFLAGRIRFTRISQLIEAVLDAHTAGPDDDLDAIVAADEWSRRQCQQLFASQD